MAVPSGAATFALYARCRNYPCGSTGIRSRFEPCCRQVACLADKRTKPRCSRGLVRGPALALSQNASARVYAPCALLLVQALMSPLTAVSIVRSVARGSRLARHGTAFPPPLIRTPKTAVPTQELAVPSGTATLALYIPKHG